MLEINDSECTTRDVYPNWIAAAMQAADMWRYFSQAKRDEYLDGAHGITMYAIRNEYTHNMYRNGIDIRSYIEKTYPLLDILDKAWKEASRC